MEKYNHRAWYAVAVIYFTYHVLYVLIACKEDAVLVTIVIRKVHVREYVRIREAIKILVCCKALKERQNVHVLIRIHFFFNAMFFGCFVLKQLSCVEILFKSDRAQVHL